MAFALLLLLIMAMYRWRNLKEMDNFEHLGVDGRIILKILKEWDGMAWTEFIWLKTATGGGFCI